MCSCTSPACVATVTRHILEGTRIVALIQRRDRGFQAFRILSMDQSTAVHPSQLPPVRTHVQVTPSSGLERAIVKWFNRTKGFAS